MATKRELEIRIRELERRIKILEEKVGKKNEFFLDPPSSGIFKEIESERNRIEDKIYDFKDALYDFLGVEEKTVKAEPEHIKLVKKKKCPHSSQ